MLSMISPFIDSRSGQTRPIVNVTNEATSICRVGETAREKFTTELLSEIFLFDGI